MGAKRVWFGALGDIRLSRRLVRSAAVQADHPMSSFPAAAQSDKAMVMGYYRMIDQPADSEVSPTNILAPHRARTLQRMQGSDVVLCIQDGTDLNFAEHPGCAGLGLIGRNKGSSGTLGLHMHSMLAVNGDGIPLGFRTSSTRRRTVRRSGTSRPKSARRSGGCADCRTATGWPANWTVCARCRLPTGRAICSSCLSSSAASAPSTCWCARSTTGRSDASGRSSSIWPGATRAQAARDPCGAQFGAPGNPTAEGAREAGRTQGSCRVALECGRATAARDEQLPERGADPPEPGACSRAGAAGRGQAPRMVPADQPAGGLRTAMRSGSSNGIACAGASRTGTGS